MTRASNIRARARGLAAAGKDLAIAVAVAARAVRPVVQTRVLSIMAAFEVCATNAEDGKPNGKNNDHDHPAVMG